MNREVGEIMVLIQLERLTEMEETSEMLEVT
jgi:hypothetical protein